jgi:hypothetical protein
MALAANPRTVKLYRNVPAEMVERLQQFREMHSYKSGAIDGVAWRYIDTGQGEPAVLALSGAACIAEISSDLVQPGEYSIRNRSLNHCLFDFQAVSFWHGSASART